MTPPSATRIFLPIVATLYALGFSNLFLRSSFGVMAPSLAREMQLAPAALSGVASAFFFAYALMQIPTGVLLDRFGPRRTLATMLLFTAAGAATFAAAPDGVVLAIGRMLMGIGCAGIFTGAFYVLALWLPPDRVVSQSGALNSFAAVGNLCATTPLALLIAWIGWRDSYWLFAALVVALLLTTAVVVRDGPPGGKQGATVPRETLRQVLSGVRRAYGLPGVKRLIFAGVPISTAATISGVWGAPYLRDIHGLGGIDRGNVLLAMAFCGMSGHIIIGHLARRMNSLKATVLTGGAIIVLAMSTLAALEKPPVWAVTCLFSVMALVGSYPSIIMAHARGLVPAELMGRGVSLTNMGTMAAIATMQFVFGTIVGLFPPLANAPPEIAYRTAFGVQALVALVALLIYAPVPDVRPKG